MSDSPSLIADSPPDAAARFAALPAAEPPGDYNFTHFRTMHLAQDGRRTIAGEGIAPGELAPEFALPRADGDGAIRLGALRGQVVLLHFGSFT
jgi:hypothetical protein